MTSNPTQANVTLGPVLLAYDGSELAAFAIAEAGRQLTPNREAVVVCVWQPADIGFTPVSGRHFDADNATRVKNAAEETARYGASLANAAGFQSTPSTVEAAPTWKGIVDAARERHASLVVIGSHRHSGLVGHLVDSVASAVVTHCACPVLVVHHQP